MTTGRREDIGGWATKSVATITLGFLVLPQIILVVESFTADGFLAFPPARYGLRWYGFIFSDLEWLAAIQRSLLVAAITTIVTLPLGFAAAYGLDRGPRRGRRLIFTLLIAPMVLPHVVLGVGQFQVAFWSHMQDTILAYALAHITIALPYAIITIGVSLQGFDRRLEEAALNLGATPWRAMIYVMLPMIRTGLVAAAIFSFITSFDEFIITYFLSTRRVTVPIQIFNSLSFQLDPSIAAISGLMLMITLGLTGILIARGQVIGGSRIIQ